MNGVFAYARSPRAADALSGRAVWTGALSRPFWLLSSFLVVVFLIGGGARADIASLALLRPLAVVVAAYGLATVTGAQVRRHRAVLSLATAAVLLHLAQLMPLPPELWSALPGREPIMEIDRLAAIASAWRPLTMTPYATSNSLWSLAVPIATLLLAVQLEDRERFMLIPVLIGLCLVSFALGLLQLLGDPLGPLYPYRVTNNGVAVGIFANRGHNALFLTCGLAMLLSWRLGGKQRALRETLAVAGLAVLLVVQILLTGSRLATVLALIVIIVAPLTLGSRPASSPRAGWAIAFALLVMALLTVMVGRGLAVERLLAGGVSEDMRMRALPTLVSMARQYAPWGAGFGSFDRVFRIHEPRELIAPSYLNHAHNDWIEVAIDGGAPAILLLLAALAWIGARFGHALRGGDLQHASLARLGALILAVFALASLSDYPLRVPSLACLAVIACVWMTAENLSFDNKSLRESGKAV